MLLEGTLHRGKLCQKGAALGPQTGSAKPQSEFASAERKRRSDNAHPDPASVSKHEIHRHNHGGNEWPVQPAKWIGFWVQRGNCWWDEGWRRSGEGEPRNTALVPPLERQHHGRRHPHE